MTATTAACVGRNARRPAMGGGPSGRDSPDPARPRGVDAAYVIQRLEAAGRTAMSLPDTGYSVACRTMQWDFVRMYWTDYGKEAVRLPRARATPADITDMDEAYGWLRHIASAGKRRIVQARSLIHPVTDRHLVSYRALGKAMGDVDPSQVKRWHDQAIKEIVEFLKREDISF
jgi:hypothetical protein